MTTQSIQRQPTETRKNEIVIAVLELAAHRSPAQIRTGDISAALGLSHGAIFKHFPNKAEIWLATIEWVDLTLIGALQAAASQHADPLAQLRAVFMAHVDFVVQHPGVPRLIFDELQRPAESALKWRVAQMLARYRGLLMGLFEAAAARAQTAPGLNREAAATLFIGMVQGLVMQGMLAGTSGRLGEAAALVFPIYLAGITSEALP
ncbi:MAG: TetR/AcrR family transcriptional regulator [Rhodocyclaceae bacterium]|nr:TetR/AcrR family transcriptional regulator [Rhodocyclaceae bacterium]